MASGNMHLRATAGFFSLAAILLVLSSATAAFASSASGVYVYDVSPQSGPTTGGTKVTLTVKGGALPEVEQYYFCKFGDQPVIAEHYTIGEDGVGTFVCLTPETMEAKQVNVTFSADGVEYTKPAKKQFAFHKPLVMENVSPSVGSIGGGTSVLVSLDGEVVSRKTDAGILKPQCDFGGLRSRGTLVSGPAGSSISCTVPHIYTLGHTDLSVSLNGVDYSVNTGNFTIVMTEEYNEVVTKVTTHAMAGDPEFHVTGKSDKGEFYGFFDMKFYDFYGFYGPSKDVAYQEKTSEVCMVAVSPSVGPSSGGTVVTVKLAGVIPEGQETFFCKFGEKVVLADSFYYTEELSPAVVCTAPDFGSGAGAVELKISFDGITYTKSGSAFYYHDDVKIDNMLPSMGTHMGGTTVGVRLSKSPMPSSFEVGLTTVPALCKFHETEVNGQYVITNDGPAVVCKTPGLDLGVVNVKISLDGQHYSKDSVAFTFTLDPEEINPDHRMAVSRYLVEAEPESEMSSFKNESFYFYNGADSAVQDAMQEISFYEFYAFYDLGPVPFEGAKYKSGEIQKVFDYLPFSPDYCLFFNVGPDTSLEKLEIDGGAIYPAFDPQTYVYVTSLVKEVDCLNVTAFPTDKNVRSVVVNGPTVSHKVGIDETSECIPLAVGENLVDVVVTGQDGQTARTYSIVAVRLQGTKSSLEGVSIFDVAGNAALNTTFFNSSVLDYVVNIDIDVSEVILTPIAEDEDALVTVVVNGATTYFGNQAVKTQLSAGSNLFEVTVEAEDGVKKTVYTFDLQREGTDLVGLELFADSALTTPIPLTPGFAPLTTVYTAEAGSIDVRFFVKVGISPSATAEIAYDIGAASFTCAGGNQEGVTKNLQNGDVVEFCNPPGTNTMTITVKFQSLSTTYTVAVKRTSAAAVLTTLANSAGNFYPPFDPAVYTYELLVMHTTSGFTLTPTVGVGAKTTMQVAYGGSSFALSSGSATSTIATDTCGDNDVITITVTAEDGVSTVTYTIQTVKLAESIHSQLAGLVLVNGTAGDIVPAFVPANDKYEVEIIRAHKFGSDVAVGTDPVDLTFSWNAPKTYTSYGNFLGSTSKITMRQRTVDILDDTKIISAETETVIYNSGDTATSLTKTISALSGELTEIELLIESCDGRTNTTYEIDVARGQGTNADMCNLVPSAGAFDTAFSTSDTLYKIVVAGDATSIGFTPTTCDSFAKIEVGACSSTTKTPWTSGDLYTKTLSDDFSVEQISTAEFCVTSEDSQTKKTYSVTITRPLSSEAVLKTLGVTLVKWDGSETTTAYSNTPTEIAATAAIAGTYEDAYFQVKAEATINTAVMTMAYAGSTYTLTSGARSAVVPGVANCVAPSLYYCDDGVAVECPEMTAGDNIVTITVTSQDGVNSKSYTVTINRPAITYTNAVNDIFLIGHPIMGLPELAAASGLTENTLTANFAGVGVDTSTVSKYGSIVAQEQILTALAAKTQLPAAPVNTDSRFRAVVSPRVAFINDIADKMVVAKTLVDRVSSGYTFGVVSTATLGDTEADSSPRVYLEPLFQNPYQSIKVEGVTVEPGCGLSLEADFGDNLYKVEVFDGTLTELAQYNVTVTRPYLPEALLSGYVSTIALDQAFVDTTFDYSTTVDDTEDEVTMSFTKFVSTSSVKAMLYYDDVLQSTVTVSGTTAVKFDLSPFGKTTVKALVQTADGTDGGLYNFVFNKFPTVLTALSVEGVGGAAITASLTPAFVDPTTNVVTAIQTSFAVTEVNVDAVVVSATALSQVATLAVKQGTTAVTAVAGKYTIDTTADTSVTITVTNGAATRVYTLTFTKDLKNAAASTSFVNITAGTTPSFAAGTAIIPIKGKTAAGEDALAGNFTCQVTGDATTFDVTFPSTFVSTGNFNVLLDTATIAGFYSYSCKLDGVAIGSSTGKIEIVGGAVGSKSILTLISTEAVRGSPVVFQVRTKDNYGNEVNTVTQSTDITVTVTQSTGGLAMTTAFASAQTANGVVDWSFTPALDYSGLYLITVTVNVGGLDTEIIGSGMLLGTTIPVTAASGWQVVYAQNYLAGGSQNVVVQPKAGVTAFKEQTIQATMTGVTRTNAAFTKTFSCDGRSTVQCTIPLGLTITGNYTLTVKIGEALVGDQTYDIKVTGNAPDLASTLLVFPETASAAVPFDVKFSLTDAFGNPAASSLIDVTQVAVTFTQGALTAVPTAVKAECYFYNCEYVVTSSLFSVGDWTAVASFTGTPIGAAKTITVTAGAADPASTSVTVLKPSIAAGVALPLTIVPKDAYGNIVKVSAMPAEDRTFEAVILSESLSKTTNFPVAGDIFAGDLVLNVAGVYNVIFKLGGTVAFQHSLTVFAGAADPTKTSYETVPASAGVPTGFTVVFKDAFSNVIPADLTTMNFANTFIVEDPVTVTVGTFTPMVSIVNQGVYFEFTPTIAGTYNLVMEAMIGSVLVKSSGYSDLLTVDPAAPNVLTSSVTGNVLGATAGVAETLEVTVRDAYGNVDKSGVVTVTAQILSGTTIVDPTMVAWNSFTNVYEVTYTATVAGPLAVSVSINGLFLTQSLKTVVSAGPLSAATSTVAGDVIIVKGQTGTLLVTAKDAFGNALTSGGAPLIAQKVQAAGDPADHLASLFITDNRDGTYTIPYTFATAGTAEVSISLFDIATGVETKLTASPAIEIKASSGVFSLTGSTILAIKPDVSADLAGSIEVTARDDQGVAMGAGGLHWTMKAADAVSGAAVPVTYSYTDLETGVYDFTFSITKAGTYTVTVANTATFNEETFTAEQTLGTFTSVITAGAAASQETTYTGAAGRTFEVGTTQEFTIALFDQFKNPLSLTATQQAMADVGAYFMQGTAKSVQTVSFVTGVGAKVSGSTTFAAQGDVFVEVGGVAKSVTTFLAKNGMITSFMMEDTNAVKYAGSTYTYDLTLFDAFDNIVSAGAAGDLETCTVTATHQTDTTVVQTLPCVGATAGDVATVTLALTKAGTYDVAYSFKQVSQATASATITKTVEILPGSASSDKSVLEGIADKKITAGQESFYVLTLSDAFGNFLNETAAVGEAVTVDSTITVGLSVGAVTTILTPVLVSQGVYQIPFGNAESLIKEPTEVTLTVALNTVPLVGSPFTVPLENILPAATDPALTVVRKGTQILAPCATAITAETSCAAHMTVVAGEAGSFSVYAYNTLGIPQVFQKEVVGASARIVAKAGQTVDAGDTGLTAEPTVTYQAGKGIYDISFSAQLFKDADTEILYAVDVIMDAGNGFTTVATTYFTVQPTQALPSASKIVATLSKISNYAALSQRYLFAHNQVNTNDKYGNQAIYDPTNPILITATAIGPTQAVIYIEPVLTAAGDISGQYIMGVGTTVAGTYFITININGVDLEAYSVTIAAGSLDAASITLTSTDSVAGVANTGKLTGTDAFGNQLDTAALTTALEGSTTVIEMALLAADGKIYTSAQMVDFMVGVVTYPTVIDFGYTVKTAGSLEITAKVTPSGAFAATTSFKKFDVAAGAVDVASSTVTGPALAGFVEDKATYFTVTLSDANGNVKPEDCSKVTVTIQEATTLATFTNAVVTAGPAACNVAFTLPSGTYNIAALYDGTTVSSFTSAAVVVVGEPHLPSTLVAGLGYGDIVAEAGVDQAFTVSLVAANGLLVPESQGATYVQVTIVDSLGAAAGVAVVTDKLNGEYGVVYDVEQTGTFTLSLLVGGALFGTTKSVVIKPTQTLAANVFAGDDGTMTTEIAGEDIVIPVLVQDKFGNNQTYELYELDAMQINIVETFASFPVGFDPTGTQFGAQVDLTVAGIYTVEFYFGATLVSTYKIQVTADEVSVPNSVVYGDDLSSAQAGVAATFFIELADEFGNLVSDAVTAQDFVNDATATMVKVGDATKTVDVTLETSVIASSVIVKATYTITETGDYYLSIAVTDEETTPPTVTTYTSFAGYVSTTVSAGKATAQTTTVAQLASSTFAGDVTFQILLQDQYGNDIAEDQLLSFFIVAEGYGASLGQYTLALPEAVVWAGDKYVVTMPITESGTYNLKVSRGVEEIFGSPFALEVKAAPIEPAFTVVSGTGTANFEAGTAVAISAVANDNFNNSLVLGAGEKFYAEYLYSTGEVVTADGVYNAITGAYDMSFATITKADTGITVVVLYDDGLEIVDVASYTIAVLPGSLDAAATTVQLSGTTGANLTTAGASVSVVVSPMDKYGNAVPVTDATQYEMYLYNPVVTPEAPAATASFALAAGVLSMDVSYTVAGDYIGDVLFNDVGPFDEVVAAPVSLIAGGLKLTVDTAEVDVSATKVTGPAAFTAGVPSSINVEFFDIYGNALTAAKPFMDTATIALPIKVGVDTFAASLLSRSFNLATQKYVITAETTKAGVMTLQFSVGGVSVYSSGTTAYTFVVNPTAFDATTTTVFGLDALSPGQSEVFFIEPRDALSNVLSTVPGTFTVTTIDSITPVVTQNPTSGLYEVRFTTGAAETLGLSSTVLESTLAIEVAYDGTVFKSLSTKTFFAAGTISAENSLMVNAETGVTLAVSPNTEKGFSTAENVAFEVVMKDTNNIVKPLTTAELANVRVSVVPSAVVTTALTPDGTVAVEFTAQSAADYSVQVFYNDVAIQGGARSGFTVSAGPAAGVNTIVSLDAVNVIDSAGVAQISTALAGQVNTLKVVAKDAFGNIQDASSARANIVATLTNKATGSTVGVTVNVKDLSLDGEGVYHVYDVEYTAKTAGTYTLTISLGEGVALTQLGLYDIDITAGIFVAAKTTLVPISTAATIGSPVTFAFAAFDNYENFVARSDVIFDLTFTKGTTSIAAKASLKPTAGVSTHEVDVTFTESGAYTLQVEAGGLVVFSGVNVVIKAGPVVQAKSTITGLEGVEAGAKATITIVPRDAAGNINLATPVVTFSPNTQSFGETVTVGTNAVTIDFTSPIFGDVTLNANFDGAIISSAMTVSPSAPPALTSVKMASLTTITVTFDMDTNNGNMGASQDCGLVLSAATLAKLGVGPLCGFTKPSELQVILGADATILPVGSTAPDTVIVKDGTILNAAGNSYAVTGGALLQAPDTTVVPSVVVKAPATVGICEDLTVDASGSFGSGGRNLAFSYSVEGLGSKIVTLSDALKALTSDQSIADIDKNAMNYGINYNFIVTATNFLGQTTSVKTPVYRGDTQVPTIFIAGKSAITTESSSKVTIPCRAEMPGDFVFDSALQTCVKNEGGDLFPVDFTWTGDKTKATFDATSLPASFASTMTTRDFTIPSNYLEAGKTYGFVCTGADAAAPDRKQSANVEITVEYSAYDVTIVGGSRDISASSVLTLEAAVFDPNDAPFPTRYAWDVASDVTYKKGAEFYSDAALTGGVLTLPANELPPGTHVFTVTASKEPLTSKRQAVSSSVTITVKEQEVLGVSIGANTDAKVLKPSKTLELFCDPENAAETVANGGSFTFAWSMTSSIGDADLASKANGVDGFSLVIPGGTLLPGVDYTFKCDATKITADSSVAGSAARTVTTETNPSSGKVLLVKLPNGKTFTDATIDLASGLGDIELIAKDWVSNADQIFYEFHAINTVTGDDILLGEPSAQNSVVSSLPVGTYKIVVYIKNDLEPQSALDVAAGAKYEVAGTVVFGDLTLAQDAARRRLLQTPSNEMEQLHYRFQVGVAEGDVPKALSFARIFGDSFGGASAPQTCTGDAAVAQIKNAMIVDLVDMDKKVVPTNEYIGLQACAYSGLLYVPGDQQQANVDNILATYVTVLGRVADTDDILSIAPSEGDPYVCFLTSLDSLLTYTKADCAGASIATTMLKPTSDAISNLAEAISDNTFASTVVRKNTDRIDIHASGSSLSAELGAAYPVTVETNGTSSPFIAAIDADELLNDNLVLSEIISLSAEDDSVAKFAVPGSSLATVPAGFEPAVKFWLGSFTDGVADFADISELEDGIDMVASTGIYNFDVSLNASQHVYVVFYAVEIKLGLSMLEFYAHEYAYTTATGQLTGAIEMTPPFSMKQFEYTVSVTNLQPIAEFRAQVAVDGIQLAVSKDGSTPVDVTSLALVNGTPTKFVGGDIDVHAVDECLPEGLTTVGDTTATTCVGTNNTFTFTLTKGDDTKNYIIKIVRSPSTQGDLQDLKLAGMGYEQLYDASKNAVSYSDSLLSYSAYVYSSVTAATVEAKAQANAPYPFGPGGAHIMVTGPGYVEDDSIISWGNSSATVGSSEPNSASKHILIGKNPVTVEVTSQDGSTAVGYSIDIYRMGKPVSVTERFAGLNANDFINNDAAQNAFVNAKAAQLGIEPYQIEILLVKSGSVIVEYVIYPVVEILRDPTATDAEKAAVESEVTTQNILGADALATTVLSKAGETLDFGDFGSGVSEITKSATPPIPRPDDLPCPVCPAGFITTTETNSDGLSYCSCRLPPSDGGDDLGDGEIAGIVIGCIVFVGGVAVVSIVIYRRRRQAQQVLSGSSDEEDGSDEEGGNEGETEAEEAE